MSLNSFDYLMIALLILSGVHGFNKGFLHAVGKLISLAAGVLLAVVYYEQFASYLQEYYGLADSVAEMLRNKIPITAMNMEHSALINGINPGDAASGLAYLIIVAISFLVIFFISSKIIQMLWSGLDSMFGWGWLSPLNRLLGMLLVVSRNLIILSIILGLIYPALVLASGMGFYMMLSVTEALDKSIIAPYMLQGYAWLKELAGIS